MSDWQTIESAPKDGAAVLVYTNGGQVTEAYWSSDNQSWILRFYDEDNRFLRAKGGMEIFHISPTHWMPLPPPPEKRAKAMTPERIAELRTIIAAASLMDEEVNMGIGKAVTQKEFYQSAKLAFPQALDTIEAQQRRIEELEAALKPFADAMAADDTKVKKMGLPIKPDDCPQYWRFCFGELRAARSALQPKGTS